MVTCYFHLNGERFTEFFYNGVPCAAFSGNGTHRNQPSSTAEPNNGAIPLGRYYIVDRRSGGTLGPLRDWFTGRDEWFALYRDDGTVDDETFINGVRRGEFRLHSIGPARTSLGCITLQYQSQFDAMRRVMLATTTSTIPRTGITTYGTVQVTDRAWCPGP